MRPDDPAVHELSAVRDSVFALLTAAPSSRDSPYRQPTLATVLDGRPRQRTVVLRAFDPRALNLAVHTDRRASKVEEVLENSAVCLHVWDEQAQVQVQLHGRAMLHHGDEAALQAWAGLSPKTRGTYAVSPAPGTVLAGPDAYTGPDRESETAQDNFAVLAIGLHGMEWLSLAGPKHRGGPGWRGGGRRAHHAAAAAREGWTAGRCQKC